MRRSLPLFLVAALSLAACSSDNEDTAQASNSGGDLTPEQQELYELAGDEPALTWYSSQDEDRNDAVIDAFLEKYPNLEASSFRLASGALANRYAQERETGINTAGLIAVAAPEFVASGEDDGWFEELSPESIPELAEIPDQFVSDGIVTAGISVFGIGYNTNIVTEEPSDWTDVLDSEYEGEIVFGDPGNVPSYVGLASLWLDEYGEDFLTQLADHDLTVVDSMVPGLQQVGAGEGAIGLPSVETSLAPLADNGAPLEIVYPETTSGNEFELMIPTDGPSPNTARLLYQFILTEEGQQAFNGTTSASPIEAEGTAELPSGYQSLDLNVIMEEQRDEIISLLGL